jgi:hypothetical protein
MQQQIKKFAYIYIHQSYLKRFAELHNLAKFLLKDKQKWNKACVNMGCPRRKLNIPMKTM